MDQTQAGIKIKNKIMIKTEYAQVFLNLNHTLNRFRPGYSSLKYSVSILETISCAKLSSSTVRTRRL